MIRWFKLLLTSIFGIWGGTLNFTNDVQTDPRFPEKVNKVAKGMFLYRMIGLICFAYVCSIAMCAIAFIFLVGGGTERLRTIG